MLYTSINYKYLHSVIIIHPYIGPILRKNGILSIKLISDILQRWGNNV